MEKQAKKLQKRLYGHKNSERFKGFEFSYEILFESDSHDEILRQEKLFVEKYNSFYDGLNNSIDGSGNHNSPNFTTLGLKFSEETREKIRQKALGNKRTLGFRHKKETKEKMSLERIGIAYGPRKISIEEANTILETFKNKNIVFPIEFVCKFVKETQKHKVLHSTISFGEMISPNGKKLTMETLYCHWYAEKYGTTVAAIRRILNGKTKLCVDYNAKNTEKV